MAIYDVEWDGNPAVLMQEQTETYFQALGLKRREIIESECPSEWSDDIIQ